MGRRSRDPSRPPHRVGRVRKNDEGPRLRILGSVDTRLDKWIKAPGKTKLATPDFT
jgi:hypothetical protein